ncbi:RRM domain-containing protein, partial [Haematococcus lacustris]
MRTRDGVSRQLAFIGYSTEEQAAAAAKYFHKTFIDATRIEVEVRGWVCGCSASQGELSQNCTVTADVLTVIHTPSRGLD